MTKEIILLFAIYSSFGWYSSAISTKREIEKLKYHVKHYPQKYIMPHRIMRKIFGLKKKEIPKWLYRRFFLSFIYTFIFLTATIAHFAIGPSVVVLNAFMYSTTAVMGIDIVYTLICCYIYK